MYKDQFEPNYPGIDVSLVGCELANQNAKVYHLFPYPIKNAFPATSSKGTKERVLIIDNLIDIGRKL